MLLWAAMLVPVATAVILYVWFNHQTLWWEFLIPFVGSLILILLCKFGTETLQTSDTEYWGGWLTRAEYYEPWDEEVPCRHPKYERVPRTNAKGETVYDEVFVGYEHLYDVDYHSPYWQVTDSNDITLRVNQDRFESIAAAFGNRTKVDLRRDYHSIDGDKFVTTWPTNDATLIPVTTLHRYENRVQATHTIIGFRDVDPAERGLFDYPNIERSYDCPSILGDGGPTTEAAERLLSVSNAKLGRQKQLRIWVLIFKNQPLEAGLDQRDYWKGGNKNEFVLAIGVNESHELQWCYPFSWSEEESLKVDARNFVIDQKGKQLDLVPIVKWLDRECGKRFVRKEFADFSYLTVDPPTWAYYVTFGLTVLLNIGLSWFVVANSFQEEGDANKKFRPSWRFSPSSKRVL